MRYRVAIGLGLIFMILFYLSCDQSSTEPGKNETPPDSSQMLREVMAEPAVCAECHPNHVQEWQQSMHAYAITDPIFLVLNNIANQEFDQFCTKCHSPMGSLLGETSQGFNLEELSPLAKNSVHCDVCHTINLDKTEPGLGATAFHLDRIRRGPIENPVTNSFHQSEFNNTYNFSEFCNPCHNVKSPQFPLFLELTGTEWNNSPYAAMGVECQTCHMPSYQGQAAINGPQRTVHHHTFVGVDYPLIDFPGKSQSILRVQELLQNSVTMQVSAPQQITAGDSFTISVTIKNDKTGHNIPTGTIFERQMWVEVTLSDPLTGTVYFRTGSLDPNGDLLNYHSEYVANGTLPEDSLLVLFNGTPIDENGEETPFFWRAASVVNRTIPAFQSRTANYYLFAPQTTTPLRLTVRLRFRSFPPYLFRAIGMDDLIDELIIFDMETYEQTINITS